MSTIKSQWSLNLIEMFFDIFCSRNMTHNKGNGTFAFYGETVCHILFSNVVFSILFDILSFIGIRLSQMNEEKGLKS